MWDDVVDVEGCWCVGGGGYVVWGGRVRWMWAGVGSEWCAGWCGWVYG